MFLEIHAEEDCHVLERVPSHLFSTLGRLIKSNCERLRKLELNFGHVRAFYCAVYALDVCPNLTELVVIARSLRGSQYEVPRWPNRRLGLTRLILQGLEFPMANLEELLKCCGDLRWLGLRPNDIANHSSLLNVVY